LYFNARATTTDTWIGKQLSKIGSEEVKNKEKVMSQNLKQNQDFAISTTPSTSVYEISNKALSEQKPDERKKTLDAWEKRDIEKLQPSTHENVVRNLKVVAGFLRCDLPENTILKEYIKFLADYPNDLLEYACEQVVKSYKWSDFPKIADFVQHMESEFQFRKISYKETLKARERWLGESQPSNNNA
tara:strand:- start:4434 stop:4994 length:561 start_codon:yes stop_codon:yes gene_type:complete